MNITAQKCLFYLSIYFLINHTYLEKYTFTLDQEFCLESGKKLEGFELAYSTKGNLLRDEKGFCKNVIWICHALTANSNPEEWWSGLVGQGKLFDPEKYFIVCANMLGSCYGSTNALSTNPASGAPYYYEFPDLSIRDIIHAQIKLRNHLDINKIHTCIGGSMGGQQALEWAIIEPNLIDNLIILASNAQHSPWGIAFNVSQRMAIENDPLWGQKNALAGMGGLKVARSIALLSYRHYQTYQQSQSEETDQKTDDFKAESYQVYQGEKLAKRFQAFSYYTLSKAMDSHNIGRNREGVTKALQCIKSRTLTIGINSDVLFPPEEQQFIAKYIPGAQYKEVISIYGHDGFLIETDAIQAIIQDWFKTSTDSQAATFNETI